MAIEVVQDIKKGSNYIAGYNDNVFVIKTTSTAQPTKAAIETEGYVLEVSPSPDNKIYFNVIELVKVLLGYFEDQYNYQGNLQDTTLIKKLNFQFKIHLINGSVEELKVSNYWFVKSVRQIGSPYGSGMLDFHGKILAPTQDVVFFKGYPFEFAKFSNGVYRYKVSSGNTSIANWSINNKNTRDECGMYVKFLNPQGAYSYWLFEKEFERQITTKSYGITRVNHESNTRDFDLGKSGVIELTLHTKANKEHSKLIEAIAISPEVYLYQAEKGSGENKWIRIFDKSIKLKSVLEKREFIIHKLSFELPNLYTQTLW